MLHDPIFLACSGASAPSLSRPAVSLASRVPPTRATTPDGVTVALHDLGGDGPPALLVHATGFHGRALGPLAREVSGAASTAWHSISAGTASLE